MASHILGIDLGAYSVKVMVVQPGLRRGAAIDFIERPVPPGDEPHEIRAAQVLGQIVKQRKLDIDSAYAIAPGDKLFIHVLEFPFRNVKRVILESAVGGELENVLPLDLEDMVFSFETLPFDLGGAQPGGSSGASSSGSSGVRAPADPVGALADDEPTNVQGRPRPNVVHGRVAQPTTGMRVLSCAMELAKARDMLTGMGKQGVEPRSLIAAPTAYARIAERIGRLRQGSLSLSQGGRGASLGQPVAIVDIGHARTDVCVVRAGRVVYGRTIARGGRDLTAAMQRAWGLSAEECERTKRQQGYIASAAEPAPTREQQRMSDLAEKELTPLARDLTRTLASCLAKTGAQVSEVVMVGGGSRLRGLPAFLSEKMRLPVSALNEADNRDILGDKLASMGVTADTACLAAGVAYEGSAGRPRYDLRQGELAYKADLSFLRQKAGFLAAVAIVVIGFAVGNGFAAHYKLRQAHQALSQRLAVETTDVFGESLSAKATLSRTKDVGGGATTADSPLPKMTAYDILLELNSHLPARDKVTLDVSKLHIKSGKIDFEASAKSSGEIDQLEEALGKIKCFKIARGSTQNAPNDMKKFTFNITSTCMGT